MRKRFLVVILMLCFVFVNFGLFFVFVVYKDILVNVSYKQVVEKLNKFGDFVYKDYFKLNVVVLCGEFVVVIVKILNVEDEVNF